MATAIKGPSHVVVTNPRMEDGLWSACLALTQTAQHGLTTKTTCSTTWDGPLMAPTRFHFLPEFTEHPKPQRRKTVDTQQLPQQPPNSPPSDGDKSDEVSFFQDFVAGGMAGSASVVVGHPFDTLKVRVQSSTGNGGVMSILKEFGGISSLYRGITAPLSAAAAINAVVFSSYGVASRFYDQYIPLDDDENDNAASLNHDPWQKSMTCGSFAGFTQCFIICPMEHVKVRLQVQPAKGSPGNLYKGPLQAVQQIVKEHGIRRLYQGWWSTFWREVPAFGLYFATYDALKDKVNTYFSRKAAQAGMLENDASSSSTDTLGMGHTHTWLASMVAGGLSGCFTWAVVYPIDVVKTKVQTASLTSPRSELQMFTIVKGLVKNHGWRYLFRGFGVTILRAFPTNATLFPVYELTLLLLKKYQSD